MDLALKRLENACGVWWRANFGNNSDYLNVLAATKGFRNGIVYGIRIRAPHALVMVFLFGQGTFREKIVAILGMIWTHAFNLGRFVFSYKLLLGMLQKSSGRYRNWHPFAAAFLPGYFVFGKENGVNTQINLYLLSRVCYGLVKLAVERGVLAQPAFPTFPWFAAIIWGLILWLFENSRHVIQNSLQSSMTYLYHDSNSWSSVKDFLFGIE